MPRFKNEQTGVVVSVAEADKDRLGPEYKPVEAPKRTRKSD